MKNPAIYAYVVIIGLLLFALVEEYKSCDGKLVRGLFWVECIVESNP